MGEISNRCGESNPAFTLLKSGRLWWCHGDASQKMIEAWKSYVANNANGFDISGDMIYDLQRLLVAINRESYAKLSVFEGQYVGVPSGSMPDDNGATTLPITKSFWSALFPTAWILSKSPEVYQFLMKAASESCNVHVMGGNVAIASDGMTAVSQSERGAAFQTLVFTNMGDWGFKQGELESLEKNVRAWLLPYQTADGGNKFLGATEYNHISPDVVGPLKKDWTSPCPRDLTREERSNQCMSLQEAVWGTDMLAKLESIKKEFDAQHLFNCYNRVGNSDFPDKPYTTV